MTPGKYGYQSGDLLIKPVDENDIWNCKWEIFLVTPLEEKIGWVSFEGEKEKGTIPISIELEPLYRNRGYGTNALKMMTEWAFLHKDIFEIRTETANDNKAYIYALERAGFVYREGLSAEPGATEVYSITRQKSGWLGFYIIIGIVVGICLGIVLDNLWVGFTAALLFATAIGVYLDSVDRHWREKYTGKKK